MRLHFLVGCVEFLLSFGEIAEIALQIVSACGIISTMTMLFSAVVNCPYLRQQQAAERSRNGGFFRFCALTSAGTCDTIKENSGQVYSTTPDGWIYPENVEIYPQEFFWKTR